MNKTMIVSTLILFAGAMSQADNKPAAPGGTTPAATSAAPSTTPAGSTMGTSGKTDTPADSKTVAKVGHKHKKKKQDSPK